MKHSSSTAAAAAAAATTISAYSEKKSWQQPIVNVFKHFSVAGSSKNVVKQGDVTNEIDKQVRSSVFKINGGGSMSACNFISLPKLSGQSLGLSGRYIYFLFKPTPSKHFTIHVDIHTQEKVAIRVTFSNMLKEFKSTSSWLQFPFVIQAPKDTVHEKTQQQTTDSTFSASAPPVTKWSILCVDLVRCMQIYTNRTFKCVRGIKLCANMVIKNVITSDILYVPGLSHAEARLRGSTAFPRELSYPCDKADEWFDFYDFVLFPMDEEKFNNRNHHVSNNSCSITSSHIFVGKLDTNNKSTAASSASHNEAKAKKEQLKKFSFSTELPTVGLQQSCSDNDLNDSDSDGEKDEEKETEEGDVHVYTTFSSSNRIDDDDLQLKLSPKMKKSITATNSCRYRLEPDPIMRPRKLIGYGSYSKNNQTFYGCARWSSDSKFIVYNCQAVVVAYNLASGQQKCFMGHSDKVSCLALSPNDDYLVSGQTGPHSLIRMWDFKTQKCLSIFRHHDHALCALEYSACGNYLCGVGKDKQAKTLLIIWDTTEITTRNSNFTPKLLAKAHTDVDIRKIIFIHYDSTSLVSCGRNNIRFWRLKRDTLRSCSLNLSSYIQTLQQQQQQQQSTHLEFTDIYINSNSSMAYASTFNGQIFEINLARMEIENVKLLGMKEKGSEKKCLRFKLDEDDLIRLNSLALCDHFCVTGSDDGIVRVWSEDLNQVCEEAEHEASISLVRISPDLKSILTATKNGNLGVLNLKKKEYSTFVRSHTQAIADFCYDASSKYLASVSEDGSVRLWNFKNYRQMYDFSAANERPTCLCFMTANISGTVYLACGFSSGKIRVFNINEGSIFVEINCSSHNELQTVATNKKKSSSCVPVVGSKYEITHLFYAAANNKRLIAGDLAGHICLHDVDADYRLIRKLPNILGVGSTNQSMALNPDGKSLALICMNSTLLAVFETYSLNEILRIDLTCMSSINSRIHCLESILYSSSSSLSTNKQQQQQHLDDGEVACKLAYANPSELNHLLCVTSCCRLLKFDSRNGQLITSVPRLHQNSVDCLTVSNDARYLITCGDNGLIKVWDYEMRFENCCQVFIGHSSRINRVMFTADSLQLITAGDSLIVWDILASKNETTRGSGENLLEQQQAANAEYAETGSNKKIPDRYHPKQVIVKTIATTAAVVPVPAKKSGGACSKKKPTATPTAPATAPVQIKSKQPAAINQGNSAELMMAKIIEMKAAESKGLLSQLIQKNREWYENRMIHQNFFQNQAAANGGAGNGVELLTEHPTDQMVAQQPTVTTTTLATWSNVSFETPRTPPIAVETVEFNSYHDDTFLNAGDDIYDVLVVNEVY